LLLWFGSTLTIVVAGACATLYVALVHEVEWIDDQVLEKRFQTLSVLIQSESERDFWLNHEVSEDLEGPRRIFTRIISSDGELLAETPSMGEAVPVSVFPPHRRLRTSSTIVGPDGYQFRALVSHAVWRQGATERDVVMQIATDTTLDEVIYFRYARTLLIVVIAALLIGVAVGAVLLARLLSPLNRIAEEIAAVNLDSLDKPIQAEGLTGELQHLTSQFNAMMARLAVSYDGLRHYADNAAHELRTPLNKLRLPLELALMRARTAAEYHDTISQAAQDCRDLSHLVDRLLFLARAANKQATLARQDIALHTELAGVREYFGASAAEAHVDLVLEVTENLVVSVDRTLFQRAINNLLVNALAHTPKGGRVSLTARRNGDFAEVEVRDTGTGISGADLPHVFERFYRGDVARTSSGGRVGLGLAIAKGVIELHGGWIRLDSAPGEGTTATLGLPISASTQSTCYQPSDFQAAE
jgi:two-component system heavy metal sensor histidine kinase CusS